MDKFRLGKLIGATLLAVGLLGAWFAFGKPNFSLSLKSPQLESASVSDKTPLQSGVPRFALQPGMELCFDVQAGYWFDDKDGKPDIPINEDGSPKYERSTTTYFVLNRQTNGSFRVVMQGASGTEDSFFTWFDLYPDGRLELIPSALTSTEFDSPRRMFPLLGKSEDQQQADWNEVDPRTGVQMNFSLGDSVIEANCVSPLNRVSHGREAISYRLDPATHLPVEVVTNSRFDEYKETHSVIATAREVLIHDEQWVKAFDVDASKCFAAIEAYRQSRRSNVLPLAMAEREKPGAVEALIEDQVSRLIATRDSINEPLFRAVMEQEIEKCNSSRQYVVKTAQQWAPAAGLPAPDWKVADLEGKEHSLQGLRGRVIVLDFWFRQCSFCIRAMPQVEEVAAGFRDTQSPVSFFGVSTDDEASDAAYVAETMKLSYPVLHSKAVAEQLGVKSFPTLFVIGPDGTLQGIFIGFSPTLKEDLTSCIQGLMKK